MATAKVLRVPKKLRDVLALLRKGKIERGLAELDRLPLMDDFAGHKAVAKAEIAYFQHDFSRAMALDEEGLPFHDRWYAGNVVDEHFVAYVRAAIALGARDRASKFLKAFYKREKELRVPASDRPRHEFHLERYKELTSDFVARLGGKPKTNDVSFSPAYAEPTSPKPMAELVEQLKKYRPKVSPRSLEGAEYMLHFVYEGGRASDFLSLYEKFAGRITFMDHHIRAAKIYAAKRRMAAAAKALRTMTTTAWHYVEEIQVAPMQLWAHDDLVPLLTPRFCRDLLALPKGQR